LVIVNTERLPDKSAAAKNNAGMLLLYEGCIINSVGYQYKAANSQTEL
jgi:hypothetical protein